MKIKNIITAGLVIGLAATGVAFYSATEQLDQTQIKTVHEDLNIKIDSRLAAYEPLLVAPYKTVDVFLSNIEEPGFLFTSVGGSWEQVTPPGTNIKLQVKFEVEDSWTEWMEIEGEEEEGNGESIAMAATNPATAMQYRFLLYGDGITSPSVKSIDWSFIRTAASTSIKETPQPKYSSISSVSSATNSVLSSKLDPAGVISRKEWGANESYRYLTNNDTDPVLVEIDDELYEQFKDELKYSRVVDEDEDGDDYKWPLQYPEKVSKIIIHHTATTKDLKDPEQAIRDIYYYHSVTKGWGDIGYNFIIDQNGKIYEGRFGGEGVIGAHAGIGNTGSIGIAVLGNYETTNVPEKVIQSLGKLISIKSKIHGIDPEGSSSFRGQNMENIFGHKDIMSTSCPGENLYEKFPIIRGIAASYVVEKEKYVKDYDFQDRSEIYYEELRPFESVTLKFKLENIGKKDWGSNTKLVIDNDPSFDGVITLPGTTNIISMKEGYVESGEKATFEINIKGGKKGDMVYLKAYPVLNGSTNLEEPIVIPISVQQSDFKYDFESAKYPEKAMNKGEIFTGWVKLENTGNVTWNRSGENTVMLGTDHERDRISAFDPTTPTRIGYLVEDQVLPGETGTFEIKLTAPAEPGYYKEYFTPVVEGVTWMSDTGMYFETTVYGGKYEAEHVSTEASDQWEQGNKYLVVIKLRNLGQETWDKSNMKIDILKELDMKVSSAKLITSEVEPGEIGTITFIAEVAEDEDLEAKTILVRPKVDGEKLMRLPVKVHFEVVKDIIVPTYAPNETPTETGDDIRIKISYEGNPEITAMGGFEIYNNASFLTSLNSGDTAIVSQTTDGLKVKTDKGSYTGLDRVRFLPDSNSILKIDNKTGDNQYRGVLEVIEDEGKLIVINELPLEHYLWGLAEEPNGEEYEKIKAIIVAARSYALHYMTDAEKFPGKPYNLSDDPATSQKYNGYTFEQRAPNVVKAVKETAGEVVYYDGHLVKTPYFSRSDGTYTKSAKDVWNWDAGFLVPVSDSYCENDVFWGHGVGLSGCGAKGMAQAGFNYKEILKHYYTGIEIKDLY